MMPRHSYCLCLQSFESVPNKTDSRVQASLWLPLGSDFVCKSRDICNK